MLLKNKLDIILEAVFEFAVGRSAVLYLQFTIYCSYSSHRHLFLDGDHGVLEDNQLSSFAETVQLP